MKPPDYLSLPIQIDRDAEVEPIEVVEAWDAADEASLESFPARDRARRGRAGGGARRHRDPPLAPYLSRRRSRKATLAT
jgi:hypothetical protein